MKNDYVVIEEDKVITIKNQFGNYMDIPIKKGTIIIYANAYGRKWEILIDKEDFNKVDSVIDGRWYVSIKKDTIYAYFCKQKNKLRVYYAMHRVIADCPEGFVVDHHPHHYGLDNRRCNLTVVTREENNSNRVYSKSNKFKY